MTKENKYKPNNWKAFLFLLSAASFLSIGLFITHIGYWLFGQLLVGVFFLQSFILLHETGHYSFFKEKRLNTIFGHFFGFISVIPFVSWVDIHNQHHKWTGWRDKDPTTTGTVNPKHGPFTKAIVNISWFLFFPLFTIGYRIGNYWNLKKIKQFSPKTNLDHVCMNLLFIWFFWGVNLFFFWDEATKYVVCGFFIGLAYSDLIILSQHSHIDIPVSDGQEVKPVKYVNQIEYTRSISIFKKIDHWVLFNFNLHEKHHAFPGVPAYYLLKKELNEPNKRNFLGYLFKAKSMSGEKFVFSTSKKSGKYI